MGTGEDRLPVVDSAAVLLTKPSGGVEREVAQQAWRDGWWESSKEVWVKKKKKERRGSGEKSFHLCEHDERSSLALGGCAA